MPCVASALRAHRERKRESQSVLNSIFGVLERAEHAIAMDQQLTAVALRDRIEGRFVARSNGAS